MLNIQITCLNRFHSKLKVLLKWIYVTLLVDKTGNQHDPSIFFVSELSLLGYLWGLNLLSFLPDGEKSLVKLYVSKYLRFPHQTCEKMVNTNPQKIGVHYLK